MANIYDKDGNKVGSFDSLYDDIKKAERRVSIEQHMTEQGRIRLEWEKAGVARFKKIYPNLSENELIQKYEEEKAKEKIRGDNIARLAPLIAIIGCVIASGIRENMRGFGILLAIASVVVSFIVMYKGFEIRPAYSYSRFVPGTFLYSLALFIVSIVVAICFKSIPTAIIGVIYAIVAKVFGQMD